MGTAGDRLYALLGAKRVRSRLSDLVFPQANPSGIESIILDINTIASYLNQTSRLNKLTPQVYQDLLLDLCYRLLESSPLDGPRPVDPLENAVHIGLTAFVSTFIIFFGRRRRICFSALSACLSQAIQNQSWTFEDSNQEFLLWLSVISGITIFNQEDRLWLLPMIRHTALMLGIQSWEALQSLLLEYPWVRILHSDASKELWNEANQVEPC
jgi:hypothetical protein